MGSCLFGKHEKDRTIKVYGDPSWKKIGRGGFSKERQIRYDIFMIKFLDWTRKAF